MSNVATKPLTEEEVLKCITTYDAPPEGFDPFTAEDRLLRKHGFPRRPDPTLEPEFRALWEKAFRSKPRWIKAEVSIDPILSKQKKHPRGGQKDFSPSGWAGAVQEVGNLGYNPPEPVVSVYGEWFIPTVTPVPSEPSGNQTIGFWVGIDGFTNGQVLQAGMAATVNGSNVTYWPWTEWYPLAPIQVNNFPIKAGDYLTVLVCAPSPTHGFCSMLNKTTNQATSIGITNPAGVSSAGATAEWIVEGISSIFPVFSTMVFHNCSGGTKDHSFATQGAIITEIESTVDGSNLTAASVPSDNSVMVKWLKQS
jgi:hypothetical protein